MSSATDFPMLFQSPPLLSPVVSALIQRCTTAFSETEWACIWYGVRFSPLEGPCSFMFLSTWSPPEIPLLSDFTYIKLKFLISLIYVIIMCSTNLYIGDMDWAPGINLWKIQRLSFSLYSVHSPFITLYYYHRHHHLYSHHLQPMFFSVNLIIKTKEIWVFLD